MCNSKITQFLPYIGCKWVRDYGQSDGGSYWWKDDKGYSYMDNFVQTMNLYGQNILHTNIGFSSEDYLRGKAPDDWAKFFNYQKEAADRYKQWIKLYKVGHEVDNTDSGRWTDTLQNYVRYLKFSFDAIKAADPSILVQVGDMARPIGGQTTNWNNGQFLYDDPNNSSDLEYVDEDTLEKILYEIVNNGNNPIYDTTSYGGRPASTNPMDYFDGGFGITCYQSDPPDLNWYDTNIDYAFRKFVAYGIANQINIEIQETNGGWSPTSDSNPNHLVPGWRYLFRTGKISRACYFHFDGISWPPTGSSQEAESSMMVDFDYNRDGQPDENIYLYPSCYGFKKITHLQSPNYEQFYNDEFKESGGTKWYNTGWTINNFSSWSMATSTWNVGTTEFVGTAGNDPNMQFRDLVLPTWQWRRWVRPDWQNWGMNRYFVVKMKTNQNSVATLTWDNTSTNYGTSDFSNSANSQTFNVTGDNQYHIYTIDLSQNDNWNGVVAAIRFDPTEVNGAQVTIDYLGFTNSVATQATKLSLSSNPSSIKADGTSTSLITATVQDDSGNTVTTSTASVRFTLSGPGSLEGTNPVTVSQGIATIIYRSGTSAGSATITGTSAGLQQGQTQ